MVPCDAPVEFRVSNPWVPLLSPLDSCAAHLGDLLGNAAKSALRTAEQGSVTLQVNCTRPCHAPKPEPALTPAQSIAASLGDDPSEWEV